MAWTDDSPHPSYPHLTLEEAWRRGYPLPPGYRGPARRSAIDASRITGWDARGEAIVDASRANLFGRPLQTFEVGEALRHRATPFGTMRGSIPHRSSIGRGILSSHSKFVDDLMESMGGSDIQDLTDDDVARVARRTRGYLSRLSRQMTEARTGRVAGDERRLELIRDLRGGRVSPGERGAVLEELRELRKTIAKHRAVERTLMMPLGEAQSIVSRFEPAAAVGKQIRDGEVVGGLVPDPVSFLGDDISAGIRGSSVKSEALRKEIAESELVTRSLKYEYANVHNFFRNLAAEGILPSGDPISHLAVRGRFRGVQAVGEVVSSTGYYRMPHDPADKTGLLSGGWKYAPNEEAARVLINAGGTPATGIKSMKTYAAPGISARPGVSYEIIQSVGPEIERLEGEIQANNARIESLHKQLTMMVHSPAKRDEMQREIEQLSQKSRNLFADREALQSYQPRLIEAMRRTDPRATSFTGRGSEQFSEAMDNVNTQVSRALNTTFGTNEADVGVMSRVFGMASGQADPTLGVSKAFQKRLREIVGSGPLNPNELAKNLFADLLYGEPENKKRARETLSRIWTASDPLSQETKKLMMRTMPGLSPDYLRDISQAAEGATIKMNIPASRQGLNNRAQAMQETLQRRDAVVRRASRADMSAAVTQGPGGGMGGIELVDSNIDWPTFMRERVDEDINRFGSALDAEGVLPHDVWRKMGVARNSFGQLRDEDIEETWRRLYSVSDKFAEMDQFDYETLLGKGVSRRRAEKALIDDGWDVGDITDQDISKYIDDRRREKFLSRSSRSGDGWAEFYEHSKPYVQDVRRGLSADRRAQNVGRALSKDKDDRYTFIRHVYDRYFPEGVVENIFSQDPDEPLKVANPFEGTFEDIAQRFTQYRDQGALVDFTDLEGETQRMRIAEAEVLEGERLRVSYLRGDGSREETTYQWARHHVEDFTKDQYDQVLKDVSHAYEKTLTNQLAVEWKRPKSYQPLKQAVAERVMQMQDFMSAQDVDGLAEGLKTRGMMVPASPEDFAIESMSKYLFRMDKPSDIVARRDEASVNLVDHIYRLSDARRELRSEPLFELGEDGRIGLGRKFTPLVERDDATLARLDEVDEGFRQRIDEAVTYIDEALQGRGLSLVDVIDVSAMRDYSSSGMERIFDDVPLTPAMRRSMETVVPSYYSDAATVALDRARSLPAPIAGGNRVISPLASMDATGGLGRVLNPEELPRLGTELPTMAELFARAIYFMDGGQANAEIPNDPKRYLGAIAEAMATQMERMRGSRDALPSAIQGGLAMFESGERPTIAMTQAAAEVGKELPKPSFIRATRETLKADWRANKSLRGAAIGAVAFAVWGFAQQRRKDHTGDQIPHLPGGSPYEQQATGPSSAPQTVSGGSQGGQSYYIDAYGSFDPSLFSGEVASITGGPVGGTTHSVRRPLASRRSTVEERMSGGI